MRAPAPADFALGHEPSRGSMSADVFLVVLLAAALHAAWNAIAKGTGDPLHSMVAIVLGHAPLAVVAIVLSPLPAPASWPYVLAGALLHVGYQLFLMSAYRLGDLTHVYPIARGAAPIIVALVSMAFLGVALSGQELLAVVMIGCGIMSIALARGADGLRNPQAALAAVATGCFIAAYSLVDGTGARLAGSSFGFYGWLSLVNALVLAGIVQMTRPRVLRALHREAPLALWLGGTASFAAYALVTWAFTRAPIALVAAVRETSIVFALLIGVLVLRERLSLHKVASTMMTISGAILLRFSR